MYTGHMLEWDVFGACLWKYEEGSDYIPYRKAMAWVKRSQPWDPTDPEPEVANALHAFVCMALSVRDWSRVTLYTAVGSPLDRWHGRDAFIEFRGRVVTIDVTQNTHKDSHKADIILPAEVVEDRVLLQEYGRKIARLLQR